jgi:hypothetical protein
VARVSGLEQHSSWFFLSTGPTRDLDDQLSGFFPRPKVGTEKSGIDIQNPNQCHARKMVALGTHLGSDQKIDSARVNGVKNPV